MRTDRAVNPLNFKHLAAHQIPLWHLLGAFISLCLIASNAYSFRDFPVPAQQVNEKTQQISISQTAWLEDQHDDLSIDTILNKHLSGLNLSNGETLNFGHSESSFWIGFKLQYQSTTDQASDKTWLLELPFPPLQRVALYQINANGEYKHLDIGYDIAMKTRQIAHRHFVFPITLKPNEEKLYFINIMRKGGSVQAPLNLWSQQQFIVSDGTQNYIFGLFYGVIFAMILYNAFLYISIRALTYLHYIVYITLSALAYFSLSGYGFLYFWPDNPELNELIIPFSSTLGGIAACVFFKSFTSLRKTNPFFNKVFNALIASGILLTLSIIISQQLLSVYVVVHIGVSGVTVLVASAIMWRQGSRQAGFFLLAWTMFILGVLCFTSLLMGWLPSNAFTRHSLLMGCVSEVLLLSFALADQINNERKAKYQALQDQHKTIVKLQDMESQLMHRALHSRATGLPNRALLRRSLDNFFKENNSSNTIGLFLISLDNFHEFNKTLGHSTGDAILKLVTHRLSDLVGNFKNAIIFEKTDTHTHSLANVEGVTFGFALKISNEASALEQAEIVLQAFERPFEYQSMKLDIESTIGISTYPKHGESTDSLLRNAHIALEAATLANNKIAFYSSDIDPYSAKRLSLIAELKSAIENDGLQLYFQPQLDLKTQKIVGAEVLIRWIHSEHGFIPPDEFIPLAERTGVIQPLTYWICEHAFSALARFKEKGFDIALSINISARNLQDRLFQSTVLQLAENNRIPTKDIILELTETAMMMNPEEALAMLKSLSRTGMRLSIDDFGTGYSSLSYLKRLPVKELKIDRTFVMEMASNQDDQTIVETTLQMAHNLGLLVVAEGIENQDTLHHLAAQGCDYAQGYHIARPMPENDFIEWLEHYQETKPDSSGNTSQAS